MKCMSCGATLPENLNFCPNCGARLGAAAPYAGMGDVSSAPTLNQQLADLQTQLDSGYITPEQFYARRAQVLARSGEAPQAEPVADAGSFGWWIIGFLFPIIGLVLYVLMRNEKPLSARRAAMGALASVLAQIILYMLYVGSVFTFAFAFALI